jgi:hypothetical protein
VALPHLSLARGTQRSATQLCGIAFPADAESQRRRFCDGWLRVAAGIKTAVLDSLWAAAVSADTTLADSNHPR